MKMKFAAAVAALASISATSAHAQYASLAPAMYSYYSDDGPSNHDYYALYSYSPPYLDTVAYSNADVDNFLSYDYEIVGPSNDSVPITLSYNLSTFTSGYDGEAQAEIIASSDSGSFELLACSYTLTNACDFTGRGAVASNYEGSVNLTVEANLAYSIELSSYVRAYYPGPNYGMISSAQAFADPVITIDQPGYTLELSPGVGNGLVSAAPEPSSWLLMISGVGLAGLMLRRRVRSDPLPRPVAAHV
jgi:hypothetical protein